jgi:AcrR family transcriptional regulator
MADGPSLRERKKQRTRRTIQRAALELFAQRGYRHVTLGEVAESADVSLRTVTVHFPTKEALVLDRGPGPLDGIGDRLRNRPADVPALDALQQWIDEQIQIARETPSGEDPPGRFLQLRQQILDDDAELRALDRGAYEEVERELATAVARDLTLEADDLEPLLVARTALSGLMLLVERRITPGNPDGFAAEVTAVLDYARSGMELLRVTR